MSKENKALVRRWWEEVWARGNLLRIVGGKIEEEWEESDLLGIERQLGRFPSE